MCLRSQTKLSRGVREILVMNCRERWLSMQRVFRELWQIWHTNWVRIIQIWLYWPLSQISFTHLITFNNMLDKIVNVMTLYLIFVKVCSMLSYLLANQASKRKISARLMTGLLACPSGRLLISKNCTQNLYNRTFSVRVLIIGIFSICGNPSYPDYTNLFEKFLVTNVSNYFM